MEKKNKVIIGLSGGVDSAVSAFLLKKMGYEIEAIFMQNWDDYFAGQETNFCSQFQDWEDAQKVAQQLEIPIHKVDFVREYWEEVFVNFLEELKQGLTPNPDILCNKNIKFHYFVNHAVNNFSADYIATGHYAKMVEEKDGFFLTKPEDKEKDQTYFLCQINKNLFNKLIFPLADLTKKEVRKIVQEINLINAKEKDSTGICFIGERNFGKFLTSYFPDQKGDLVDIDEKKIIGHHQGFQYYTIGQRRKLNLQGQKEPFYVVGKDKENNIVYVAKENNQWINSQWCVVDKINWLVDEKYLKNNLKNEQLTAKFRYRQKDVQIKINFLEEFEKVKVDFLNPQRAITPGQYAVFYQKDICLGGGIILFTEKNDKFSNLRILKEEKK